MIRGLAAAIAVVAAVGVFGTRTHAATCTRVGKKRICLVEGKPCPPVSAKVIASHGFVCANALLRVPATVAATISVPSSGPAQIGVFAGAVWVQGSDSGTLIRIDPTTNSVAASIPTAVGGGYLDFGDGSVWAAESGGDAVYRVDPSTNNVVATIQTGASFAWGVATVPGAVYVANHRHPLTSPSTIVRIDTATNQITATAHVGVASGNGSAGPGALAVAAGGVWTYVPNANGYSRIDLGDGSVKSFTGTSSCDNDVVAVAGTLWFADACSNVLTRVDPATGAATAQVQAPAGSGDIFQLATDGTTLWALGDKGLLFKVDPSSNRVVQVRYLPAQRPGGGGGYIACGAGSLWASDDAHNTVLRVTP